LLCDVQFRQQLFAELTIASRRKPLRRLLGQVVALVAAPPDQFARQQPWVGLQRHPLRVEDQVAWKALIRVAESECADAIVVGRHQGGFLGRFSPDDAVELTGPDGKVFAKGLVRASSEVLTSIAGKRTADLPDGVPHEVVHRDDLVVLPS